MPIDKTKDKILKVSRELFMRKGYDSTSMSEIASLVGINKSSLYYFFKNKECLYFEIMKNALNNILDYLREVERGDKFDFERIIENLLNMSSKNSIIAYILDTNSIKSKSKQLNEMHQGIQEIHKIFEKICKNAGVKEPHTAAEVTLNSINAFAIKSSCHKIDVKPDKYANYLAKLLKN